MGIITPPSSVRVEDDGLLEFWPTAEPKQFPTVLFLGADRGAEDDLGARLKNV